mgnify:CR=1 FL=1
MQYHALPFDFDAKKLGTVQESGLYCWRAFGEVHTNVPRVLSHHSPTGFEFGYGGSGPADLAMNVLHALLPPQPGEEYEPVRTPDDKIAFISKAAARHYQEFKFDAIARLPREGGRFLLHDLDEWLEARGLWRFNKPESEG